MTSIYSLLIGSLLAALIVGAAYQLIHNLHFSPLRHIPGPWWTPLTQFPVKIQIVSANQVHYFHSLHQRYGPFVRIGPQQIIVSDVEVFQQIHRIGTPFVKSKFYTYLNPTDPGEPPYSVFAETNPRKHAARRKLLARGFTQAELRKTWEDVVLAKATLAVASIARAAADDERGADVRKWWLLMAADIVSHLMFGESFDLLMEGQEKPWFARVASGTGMNAIAWHFPYLYFILKYTPIRAIQDAVTASRLLYAEGQAAVTNSGDTSSVKNLFANVLAQAEKSEGGLTDEEIFVEAGSFCIAGTDTTGNTLTYLIWAVLKQPELQKALQEEVGGVKEPLSDVELAKLPVLNAVIAETLRLYGAAPGALLRVAPPEGAVLGGYTVPGGTVVSTQAWSLHRDPELFPDPEKFDHTRFLPNNSPGLSDRAKAAYSPFGAGSRICIGMALAYMELRIATALFFRECKGARLAPSVTEESMKVENVFLIAPVGGECRILLPKKAV